MAGCRFFSFLYRIRGNRVDVKSSLRGCGLVTGKAHMFLVKPDIVLCKRHLLCSSPHKFFLLKILSHSCGHRCAERCGTDWNNQGPTHIGLFGFVLTHRESPLASSVESAVPDLAAATSCSARAMIRGACAEASYSPVRVSTTSRQGE